MRLKILFAVAPLLLFCASASAAPEKLSPADEAAAFTAAGFKLKGKQWRACVDDPSPNYVAGTPLLLTARVVDAFGNALASAGRTVTFSLSNAPGASLIPASPTAVTDATGRAQVSTQIQKAGISYRIVASTPGLGDGQSVGFFVAPASPAKLAWGVQPPDGQADVPLSPAPSVHPSAFHSLSPQP